MGLGTSVRSRRKTLATWLSGLLLVIGAAFPIPAAAASDSQGHEFWLAFPGNLGAEELTLFIAGPTATTGTVAIPGLAFSTPFTVTPGAVTTVSLPLDAQIESSDLVADLGIHVTSGAEVSVYGLNRVQFTTDAFLGLPVDILGTSYIVVGYRNTDIINATQFALVATAADTTVTITPSVTTDGHPAGTPYDVTLGLGQTYQLRNTDPAPADLSGTIISSDKPIAVFGGHQCANVPDGLTFACDHLVEQLPPLSTWGTRFVTMPLATRVGGDTFRIVAAEASTTVNINGSSATLGAGAILQQTIDGPASITSDKPILVVQYSNGSTFDGVTSDPFMMLVPPYEQFLAAYTVTTPATGFATNFINLVVPDGAVGSVEVDGVAIPAGSYTAIGTSGFQGVQHAVSLGSHSLSGPLPFGAFMYGFDEFDSYGYPGGQSLAPIVSVKSIALSPKTSSGSVGAEHCVDALVLDQSDAPLAGIRVDFAVTGANSALGFATTDSSGIARFCYTGSSEGSDTVTGSVGLLSDTASRMWNSTSNPPPTVDAGGPYSGTEGSLISLLGGASNTPSSDIVTHTWSYTLGVGTDTGMACTFGDGTALTTTISCTDDGPVTITLTADDGINAPVADTALVTVANADPGTSISSPADGSTVGVGSTVALTAARTDPGRNDSHTCLIDWGDGTIDAGTLTATTCSGSHVYSSIAVPTIRVTIEDDDGGSAFDEIMLVVAEARTKVTGGGWTQLADGRLRFGLVAHPGTPDRGQLQARWGTHRFHGKTVTGLVAVAPDASWSGSGRYDGRDGYTYEVRVFDGVKKKSTPDTFTIVIRDGSGTIVFSGGGPLKGGNIKIH